MGPGPPPLGPWGASQGFPGEGFRPNVLGPERGEPSWFWHRFFVSILTSIFDRLGVDLGSVLGLISGRFGTLIGQSWSQDRLRTILTSKK